MNTDPDLNWWQIHIRGYDFPDESPGASTIELTSHFEPEPTEHPDAHIRLSRIDQERGMRMLTSFLEEREIDYEYYSVE